MYLHIGNNKNLRTRDMIGIFDLDTASVSATTKGFLRKMEKEGRVESAGNEIPKSFILTGDGRVHFSQISTMALQGRKEL